MTWSVAYEHAYTGTNADKHDFWVYFFDTFLNGRGGWTTNLHPNGDAYRRQVQRTMNNTNTGETAVQTWRFNVSWSSVTPTTHATSWYVDANYTTTPGDVGTDSGKNVGGIAMPNLSSGDKMKIWTSDQNTDNWFVTFGGIWQGGWVYGSDYTEYGNLTDIAAYNAGSSPGTDYPGTVFGPGWGTTNMTGPPGPITAASWYVLPLIGAHSSGLWNYVLDKRGPNVVFNNFATAFSDSSSLSSGTVWVNSGSTATDVAIFATSLTSGGTKNYTSSSYPPRVVLMNNTDYYITVHSTDTSHALAFYCGTSEPTIN